MASQPSRPHAPALVELKAVSKRFDNGLEAVSSVDFSIAEGEFLSLLGPSGCGKSTLLRMIAGLIAPTGGSIIWPQGEGRDHLGEIGFVFQDATLMPWATVFDNVWLPLRLKGVGRAAAETRVGAMLAAVGLDDFARAYPRELSGGMKMRVSIARALVTEPKLLLMDEPFAALDEMTREKLNDDILALHKASGCTIVFVTHSVFESAYLSDRVMVMSARPGRISAEIDVLLLEPRTGATRLKKEYAAICSRLSQALKAAAPAEVLP